MAQDPGTLTPGQVAGLLRATATSLQAAVGALPPGLAGWHPEPGAWCSNEILGHYIGADRRGFGGRLRSMLGPADPRLLAWDRVAAERSEQDCARQPVQLLHEFLTLRAANAVLATSLSEEDLQRERNDPRVGRIRVVDLLHDWVYHDHDHLRQLLANVQAAVWPHLGNAQRYYGARPNQ